MSTRHREVFERLAAEFHPTEVRSRKQGGRDLRYITARVAMNRLDEVLGPENWRDEYAEGERGLKCRLWFRLPGSDEWSWKEDGGAPAGMSEADNDEKSAFSDAFKRACVKLGVGRYLYNDGVPLYPEERPPALGRGSGLGTKEHLEKVKRFNGWLSEQCRKINASWHEQWEARCERAMRDGHDAPTKIEDVINPWQAKGHLVKWAVETGRLDPSIVPEDAKVRDNDALCALVYFRSTKDRVAMVNEMGEYLKRQRRIKDDKIYRQNPELAPDGHAEEAAESADRGDAFEGDLEPAASEAG